MLRWQPAARRAALPDRAVTPARGRHRATVAPRPGRARAWTALSIALASVGIAAVLPRPATEPAASHVPLTLAPAVQPWSPPEAPPPPEEPAGTLPESLPLTVSIPALGVSSDVVRLGLAGDGSMEVPSGAYPAGWYEGSPTPGELGPAVLAGHVDWAGEAGVFAGIGDLDPGDVVRVHRADGQVATFAVERVERYAKDRFPTAAVYGDIDHAGLRLITCGGVFDEDSQDYRDNVVVFARLMT